MVNLISQGNSGSYGPGVNAYAYCHANNKTLITDNHAYNSTGGVVAYYHSSIALTMPQLQTTQQKRMMLDCLLGQFQTFLTNSILWGQSKNQDSDGEFIFANHSIIDGGHDGDGVMDVDPMFVDGSLIIICRWFYGNRLWFRSQQYNLK